MIFFLNYEYIFDVYNIMYKHIEKQTPILTISDLLRPHCKYSLNLYLNFFVLASKICSELLRGGKS